MDVKPKAQSRETLHGHGNDALDEMSAPLDEADDDVDNLVDNATHDVSNDANNAKPDDGNDAINAKLDKRSLNDDFDAEDYAFIFYEQWY